MRFPSRKDRWLAVIIWFSIILIVICGLAPFFAEEIPDSVTIILLIIMWGMAALMIWMWMGTYYVLEDDHLLIRFGPVSKRLPYAKIRKINQTRSVLSSFALSTRRLEIRYNRFDLVYISPEEEDRMLELLRERCPHAEFVSDINR